MEKQQETTVISLSHFKSLKQVSEENLGASSGGGGSEGGQSGHKKLILKRESCSCDSADRVSDAGSRRSKSIGGIQSLLWQFQKKVVCALVKISECEMLKLR